MSGRGKRNEWNQVVQLLAVCKEGTSSIPGKWIAEITPSYKGKGVKKIVEVEEYSRQLLIQKTMSSKVRKGWVCGEPWVCGPDVLL